MAVTITSNGGGATADVSVEEGQVAVTTVTANGDDPPVSFGTDTSPDQGAFSIDPDTGVLTFNSPPDFDNPTDDNLDGVYEVTVLAADQSESDTQEISVTVVGDLTTNLIGYWTLDEASGTRADSHDDNDLTDNNTVTQQTGKVADCAQFTAANSEMLEITDNADLSTGNIDFTFAGWVYLDSKGANRGIAGKSTGGDFGEYEWELRFQNSTDRFLFSVQDGTSNANGVSANNLGAPSTATWYFIVVWHDAAANTINIQVNDGTVDSAAYSSGSWDSTLPFRIGKVSTLFWDGRIDECGFWKRVLIPAQRTYLYNAGSGRTYADFAEEESVATAAIMHHRRTQGMS